MFEDTNWLDGAHLFYLHDYQLSSIPAWYYYSCSLRPNYMRNTFVLFLLELQVKLKLNYHVYLFHLNENKQKKKKKKT